MNLFSIKPFRSLPINPLRCALFSTRTYTIPKKNPNPNFKFISTSSMATTPNPNGESIAKRLWVRFNNEAIRSLYTPFVVSLASGNLKLDTFRHYIAQDVHFLKSFAQAYELAEECADDDADKVSISELRQSVLEELEMHGSFCLEWGFDVSKETMPNSATLKYTDFLLATASGKIEGVKSLTTPLNKSKVAAYTIGSMVPCMRLYAFLGNELESFVDIHHPFKKWIDNYSSEAFQAAAVQTEDLLDKLSVALTSEELAVMQKLYHRALKLETEFFLAQPLDQQTVVPLLKEDDRSVTIFSDFDLTCTVVDSCAVLAEIAIASAPKLDMPVAELRNTWDGLSRQYAEEYQQCLESMLADHKVEKFNFERLQQALEQLSDFEKRANTRVIDSGVLKGLNREDIKRAGEHLVLQDGCIDFFKHVTKNANLYILSYCWCGDLIRSAFSSVGIPNLQLHANEFIYEGLRSTGEFVKNVQTPIDKLRAFSRCLKDCGKCAEQNISIYIGDSVGDLLCLLQADIGIVIGSSSSLRRVGAHFGVTFVPLIRGVVMKQRQGNGFGWNGPLSGFVYTVSSWAEIQAFILGS